VLPMALVYGTHLNWSRRQCARGALKVESCKTMTGTHNLVVCEGEDGTLSLRTFTDSSGRLEAKRFLEPIVCLAVDEEMVACSLTDGTIVVWSIAPWRLKCTLSGYGCLRFCIREIHR